ncbi:MAG: helix-turn-helix domain-containing protein [Elusimicrobiota bacterium]
MANLYTILKSEIVRLARRATRPTFAKMKKDVVVLKHQNAEYRRILTQLQRDNTHLMTDLNAKLKAPPKASEKELEIARLSPRLIRSQRKRLGLSRESFAKLLGVSAGSVVGWEGGKAKPRAAARGALIGIRKLGKREARKRLEVIGKEGNGSTKHHVKKHKRIHVQAKQVSVN